MQVWIRVQLSIMGIGYCDLQKSAPIALGLLQVALNSGKNIGKHQTIENL